MTPNDARGRAWRIEQNSLESPTIPPRLRMHRIRRE
jgi:hypothetical protein